MEKIVARHRSAQFSPAEAERIAEVSTDLQRNWRRRGFLPVQAGHSRYEPQDVAGLMIMKRLSDFSFGPSQSQATATALSRHVYWLALADCDAAMEVAGEPEQVRDFRNADSELYLDAIAGLKGGAFRFVMIHADGRFSLTEDPTADLRASNDEVTVLIDLAAISRRLVREAGRPLVHVSISKVDQDAE